MLIEIATSSEPSYRAVPAVPEHLDRASQQRAAHALEAHAKLAPLLPPQAATAVVLDGLGKRGSYAASLEVLLAFEKTPPAEAGAARAAIDSAIARSGLADRPLDEDGRTIWRWGGQPSGPDEEADDKAGNDDDDAPRVEILGMSRSGKAWVVEHEGEEGWLPVEAVDEDTGKVRDWFLDKFLAGDWFKKD